MLGMDRSLFMASRESCRLHVRWLEKKAARSALKREKHVCRLVREVEV